MAEVGDPVQEIAELHGLLAEYETELAAARAALTGARLQIEQYRVQLAVLRRMQFGRWPEKLDRQMEQLELMLEDLEDGEAATRREPVQARGERRQPVRRPPPEHLPREEVLHYPGSVCPGCGGT